MSIFQPLLFVDGAGIYKIFQTQKDVRYLKEQKQQPPSFDTSRDLTQRSRHSEHSHALLCIRGGKRNNLISEDLILCHLHEHRKQWWRGEMGRETFIVYKSGQYGSNPRKP